MTQPRPSQVVARHLKQERRRQEISAAQLADRCAELGMPELNRDVITNIENGRRHAVTVDELYVLGAALNVPPTLLTLPLGEERRFAVTPTPTLHTHPYLVLDWLRGTGPLLDSKGFRFTRWHDDWRVGAAPALFYDRLHDLRRALAHADDPEPVLAALRDHVRIMASVGLDDGSLDGIVDDAARKVREKEGDDDG